MILIIMLCDDPLPPPFDSLPDHLVAMHRLQSGQTLFRQGDRPVALFLVQRGAVALIRHTEAGRKVRLFRAKAGDTLAEASLFSESYHCDCIAGRDSILFGFDKAAVLALMASNPEFSMALVRRLSVQLQAYRRKLELLAIGSAKERVLVALADGWLSGSVIEFAGELGLSHEATYRALAHLVQQGRARKTGRGRYCAIAER